MGAELERLYAKFKDWLFDLSFDYQYTVRGEFAYWLNMRLPMTRSERRLYARLFGEEG